MTLSAATLPVVVLLLRVLFAALLALFLGVLVWAMRADLRRTLAALYDVSERATRPMGLVVVQPGPTKLAVGQRFPLDHTLTIGRGADNDITIDDDFVSHHHARVLLMNTRWHIEDLGSRNGCSVNGVSVTGIVPLPDRARLAIGRVTLRLDGVDDNGAGQDPPQKR